MKPKTSWVHETWIANPLTIDSCMCSSDWLLYFILAFHTSQLQGSKFIPAFDLPRGKREREPRQLLLWLVSSAFSILIIWTFNSTHLAIQLFISSLTATDAASVSPKVKRPVINAIVPPARATSSVSKRQQFKLSDHLHHLRRDTS